MFEKLPIFVVIFIAAVTWAFVLLVQGTDLSWAHFVPFGFAVTTVTLFIAAFEHILWHRRPFSWFFSVPSISGTWAVELRTSLDVDGRSDNLVEGYASIRQTFSTVSIRLMTKGAHSFLVADNLKKRSDGVYELTGVYQSEPNFDRRKADTQIHFGAFKIVVCGTPPTEMNGHYWTDRDSKGSIIYRNRVDEIFDTYDSASISVPPKSD